MGVKPTTGAFEMRKSAAVMSTADAGGRRSGCGVTMTSQAGVHGAFEMRGRGGCLQGHSAGVLECDSDFSPDRR